MKRKSFFLLTLAICVNTLTGCFNFGSNHEHTYNSFWTTDANQHWHGASCDHKDLKTDIGNHVDSDNNGKCDVCGHDVAHEHTFSNNWTSDDTYHWHIATCGHDVISGKAEHIDNNMDGACDTCEHAMQPIIQEVTITVINGTGGGKYAVGDTVTIEANAAPEGQKFKEWQVNGEKVSEDNPYTFDAENDITLTAKYVKSDCTSILAISDIHITGDDNVTKSHLVKTLQYVIDNKIDIVLVNGDLISWATKEMYDELDSIFTECFKEVNEEEMPDFVFNMGNHEFYSNSSCRHQDTDYDRETGLFYEFASKWMKEPISDNIYMRSIKGVNIISGCPGKEEKDGSYYLAANGVYSDNDISKLKGYLDVATKDDEPVIVLTHQPWGYTYGGSYRVPNDSVKNKMTGLLKNYPSVINLTSHTHFSNLNERTFNQKDYTSINIGTHAYGKYASEWEVDELGEIVSFANVNDHNLYNDSLSSKYHGTTHFGIGLDFTEENIIAKRIDLANGVDYKHGTWTIPYGINKDNKSEKFYYEDNERTKEQVNFSETDKLTLTPDVGAYTTDLTVSFKDVSNYWAVEGYKVEIFDENDTLLMEPTWWQSMYWANLNKQSEYEFAIKNVKNNPKYHVVISPMNFFGEYGEHIEEEIDIEVERSDEEKKEIASGDLLYLSKIVSNSISGENKQTDRKCITEVSTPETSGYSTKVSGNENADGWPCIKYELPEPVDLSEDKNIVIDTKFVNMHNWFSLKLYNSSGEKVIDGEIGVDTTSTNWCTNTISADRLKEKTASGYDLKDVLYIELFVNFDKNKGNIQKAYFDNLFIKDGIAFETYTSSTTIPFDETIPSISASTKHIVFYTQTTTAFTFALVAKDDGTRTSAKVTITIGDGTNITVTNVASAGWSITKKDNYYIVDILISAIGVNNDLPTGKINFRDALPVTVAKLHLE